MRFLSIIFKLLVGILLMLIICFGLTEAYLKLSKYKKYTVPWNMDIGLHSTYRIDKNRIFAFNNSDTYVHKEFDKYGFRPMLNNQTDDFLNKDLIVMIGSSYVWGVGIEDDSLTYPSFFERNLNNKQVSVINAAVPGYSADQEYVYIKDEIVPNFKPKLVIWNVDISEGWDSNYACLFNSEDGYYKQVPGSKNYLYIKYWIINHLPRFIANSDVVNVLNHSLTGFLNYRYNESRYTIGCTEHFTSKTEQNMYLKLKYFLNEMEKISENSGIKFMVVLTPYDSYFNSSIDNASLLKSHSRLIDVLSSSKTITFIDSNSEMLKKINHGLYEYRVSDNKEALSKSNPYNQIFMTNNQGDENVLLTNMGNNLFATVVSDQVKKLVF